MAYSHVLTYKGIKRKDSRMAAKGAASASVSSFGNMPALNQAIDSMKVQG